MKKPSLWLGVFLAVVTISGVSLGVYAKQDKRPLSERELLEKFNSLPDSTFNPIKVEDLLNDEVYIKLSQDGWSPEEIVTIMNTVMADKSFAKTKDGYPAYAKQWLPQYGRVPGGDSIYELIDPTYNEMSVQVQLEAVGEDLYNKTWRKESYTTPLDRFKAGDIDRRPGYFRYPEQKPSSGRIAMLKVNNYRNQDGSYQDPDGNQLYVIPDGCGMFRTDDGGKNWTCITDNIPERAGRAQSRSYVIAVDPWDWDHVFGFMSNNKIYESFDRGETWEVVPGATAPGLKRGHAFRDSQGNLRFIGGAQNTGRGYWASQLRISEDKGVTWTNVAIPNECQDDNPTGAGRGVWVQEFGFDPLNPDKIWICGSRSLLYFDDGARPTIVNGQKVYNLKRKRFNVYGYKPENEGEEAELRVADTDVFPIAATSPGFIQVDMAAQPGTIPKLWFAASIRSSNQSALYYSEDGGDNWYTLHDSPSGYYTSGSRSLFGNEAPYGWLGGFGVNLKDNRYVLGCTMSSAQSDNGGKSFGELAWGIPFQYESEDRGLQTVHNSRHNADNHIIDSHVSGKMFRGSDGGLFERVLRFDDNGNLTYANWHTIGGNMGQMLFYGVRANEFGDHMIIGNTQDIDVQTWRYGRWGKWRGYEGTEAWINPYGNTGYFSGGGGGGWENMSLGSWRSAVCMADVHTGNWYMTRTSMGNENSFFRVDDFGRSVVNLYDAVGEGVTQYVLARDKGRTTIFVQTASNKLMRSTDGGNSFEYIYATNPSGQVVPAAYSGIVLAADPNDSSVLYFARAGVVYRMHVNTGTLDDLSYDLPAGLGCSNFLFHEGTGDLYFVNSGTAAIYILRHGTQHWEFWNSGFGGGKFGSTVINYTSQEMYFHDFGRGVWVADLDTPADRFFRDGSHLVTNDGAQVSGETNGTAEWDNILRLKEYSNVDGRRTIGIDTSWTIPLYYNYRWWVNNVEVDNPYQYLTRALEPGDRVQLELTLRESPDVHTKSAVYVVGNQPSTKIDNTPGYALHSSNGRVDIGYNDFFYRDFTVDFWIKPNSNGVIICNRQYGTNKGAKGWLLVNNNGTLQVVYSPANILAQANYNIYNTPQWTFSCGSLTSGEWQHVAFTEARDGKIRTYINGIKTNELDRNWNDPNMVNHSLNNNMYLSLFADAWEYSAIDATIDELNIWDRQLSDEEIRAQMFTGNSGAPDGLRTYYSFNGATLNDDAEAFTGYKPFVRTRAIVNKEKMLLPIDALHGATATTSGTEPTIISDGEMKLMGVSAASGSALSIGAYTYDTNTWVNESSNRPSKYYDITPTGYMVYAFGGTNQNLNLEFFSPDDSFDPEKNYRVYVGEIDDQENIWMPLTTEASPMGELTYNEENRSLVITNVPASEVILKKLIVAATKPAIEVVVDGLTRTGQLKIYDAEKETYDVHATLLDNLTEPIGAYRLNLSSDVLKPMSDFYFAHGRSDIKMRLNISRVPNFGDRILTMMEGEDDNMMPMKIDVINQIAPRQLGTSVAMQGGSVTVGTAEDYISLHGKNNMTIMGWFRIDDAEMLTGTKSLMFFRNSNPAAATGIFLNNGNVRFNWANNNNGSAGFQSNYTLTEADLGKWHHIAVVMTPGRMYIMFDGVSGYYSRTYSTTSILSPLLLGADNDGDTWFHGAFDQVAVWNRALSQDEVVKFMQERVPLNDEGLVAYANMDYFDGDGNLLELVTGHTITPHGNVLMHHESVVPFDAQARYTTEPESPMTVTVPMTSGAMPTRYVTTYEGSLHNFYTSELRSTHRLNKEYYTIVYSDNTRISADGTATIAYRHPTIIAGDELTLAVRPLGSVTPFTTTATATATTDGQASFSVPASAMRTATEVMFFVSNPNAEERPINVETYFGENIENGSRYMLNGFDWTIPVKVKVISGSDEAPVSFVIDQPYATLDREQIDMTGVVDDHVITIDEQMLDRNALNPLDIHVLGANVEDLHLDLYIEPIVNLRLKNGDNGSASQFVARNQVARLEIEAELVDGYLDENVELSTMTDLNQAMSVGTGTLLSGEKVSSSLEYFPSENDVDAGWNFIANPYVAKINLTKHQNVEFSEDYVTKYIYQYDPVSQNFYAYDMTTFLEDHAVLPFQPFFVQTVQANATLAVTPVAKQKKIDRKIFDSYEATEVNSLRVNLYDGDGQLCDRTDIIWHKNNSLEFFTGEDAPKMMSVSEDAHQLYSYQPIYKFNQRAATVDQPMSINACAWNVGIIPLGISSPDPDGLVLKFENNYVAGDLRIVDRVANTETHLSDIGDEGYPIETAEGNRYYIKSHYIVTGIEDSADDNYLVLVDNHEVAVTGLHGDARVRISAVNGMQIAEEITSQPQVTFTLSSGVYIATIFENGRVFSVKFLVK